jgi:acyl phosphate:glycerol-3-phosphate acyltransferase
MSSLSAVIFLSYLLGSVSFAILVSRLRGLADPRSYGSGNPGATNMLRSGDKAAAALTLLGDAAKGLVAVVMVRLLFLPTATSPDEADLWLAAGALSAFLGHLFPVFFRFKGGKGVATALGVLLGLSPLLGLLVLAVWLTVFGITRVSSLSALSAAVAAPVLAGLPWTGWFASPIWWAVLSMSLLLLLRHHSNIRDLLSGKERPFRASASEKSP